MTLAVFASCNATRTESVPDRFKMSVGKLRNVGFFEEYKSFSDDQLTDSLIAIAKKKHKFSGYDDFEEVYDPIENAKWFDLHIAELDDRRVWWHDLESDICKENLIYRATIKEYEKLSGGYLNAREIKEDWRSDYGPIEISFWDGDTLRVFHPEYNEDWYDVKFFSFLETTMVSNGSPYKFYMHDQTGQDVFLIRATEEEMEKIEKQMEWKFERFVGP